MEAERGLVGRIGCKIVSLREDIDGLHHELAELGQLQNSLSSSRTVSHPPKLCPSPPLTRAHRRRSLMIC